LDECECEIGGRVYTLKSVRARISHVYDFACFRAEEGCMHAEGGKRGINRCVQENRREWNQTMCEGRDMAERDKPRWVRLGYVRDRTCPGSRARVRELLCSMGRYATTASGVLRARVEPSEESACVSPRPRYGGALSPSPVMTAAAEPVARDPWRKACL